MLSVQLRNPYKYEKGMTNFQEFLLSWDFVLHSVILVEILPCSSNSVAITPSIWIKIKIKSFFSFFFPFLSIGLCRQGKYSLKGTVSRELRWLLLYINPNFFNFLKGTLHNQQKKIQFMNGPTILDGLHNSKYGNHDR